MQALVVALMMMVVFACAIMFGHAYDAKIVTGQTARAAAWTQGGKGCGGAKPKLADDARPVATDAAKPTSGDVVSKAADVFFALSTRTEQSGKRNARMPALLGGHTLSFATDTQFACNEEPDLHGDIWSIASWAVDLFGDLITGSK